uniref:Uncharacterized protein n=1 Tax=Leersia perrieri TaxID=77586 RepID=A0A0D9Y0P2_9ORYZ
MAQGSSWLTTSPTRYWQHRCAHSSRVVHGSGTPDVIARPPRRLFSVIFLNDCCDRITVFIYCASSCTPVLGVLPCAHDHSMASLVRLAAWLVCSSSAFDFGYIDHGYSTRGYHDHDFLAPLAFGYID